MFFKSIHFWTAVMQRIFKYEFKAEELLKKTTQNSTETFEDFNWLYQPLHELSNILSSN